MLKAAKIALEDGTIIKGKGFGYETIKTGELVFSTGMTGYVEALTDPSFKGQILMNTYPLQGNYGISKQWYQSDGIKVDGLVVREYCSHPSHHLSEKDLSDFLREYEVPGISGIDTRYLTIKLREQGSMKAALSTQNIEDEDLLDLARAQPSIVDRDLVDKVSVHQPRTLGEDFKKKMVIIDCGYKKNVIKSLLDRKVGLTIVPYHTEPADIMDYDPDAILISSGPGNPNRVKEAISTVKNLAERLPIFGVCFGLQIIALAFNAKIYKMKFGHRGANQPVKDLNTGKVSITSQNHGFAVDSNSLKDQPLEVTQINLNDGTLEGITHQELPIYAVQYHPEAGPGPNDTNYIFDEFVNIMHEY